jgi:6-pyruvoyltetrahydropterin/6-carboxytetrahydropterin synthase
VKTTITKRVTFCAGHRLYNPSFDERRNQEVFGECSNPNGHGHNYVLEVSISGPVDPDTGMILNLKDLKTVIDNEVVAHLDHKNLNVDVAFMRGVIPTSENLAGRIWELLDARFGKGLLTKVILWESENNRFEVSR